MTKQNVTYCIIGILNLKINNMQTQKNENKMNDEFMYILARAGFHNVRQYVSQCSDDSCFGL